MTTYAIQLADGRTTIELDSESGELTERGASFPVLHRPVVDSWELLKLLFAHKQEIMQAYQKSKTKLSDSDITVSKRLDGMPNESGGRSGATSSIQIADELKTKQPGMISPSRGA